MKSALNMFQLMDHIDKHKRLEGTRFKEKEKLKCF